MKIWSLISVARSTPSISNRTRLLVTTSRLAELPVASSPTTDELPACGWLRQVAVLFLNKMHLPRGGQLIMKFKRSHFIITAQTLAGKIRKSKHDLWFIKTP